MGLRTFTAVAFFSLSLLGHTPPAQVFAPPGAPPPSGTAGLGSHAEAGLPVMRPHLVELSGSGYDRGFQHGQALKTEIGVAVQRWKDDIRSNRKRDPDLVLGEFLRDTDFIPAIKHWTPDLLDEVRGIAEGSGQSFETMLAFQCVDELWVYFNAADAHHCSGIGIPRRGAQPARVSQNLDLETFRDGSQTLLHLRSSTTEPEQFVFTVAGLIGCNGMNGSPVAVAVNTLMQLSASRDGLPVAFVVRGLLARTGEREVLQFLRSVKHASGQNYLLGIGDKVYDFEASATQVVRYRPAAKGGPVYHTNHPLANRDLKPWYRDHQIYDNSYLRFASLDQRFGGTAPDLSEGSIKAALRAKDSEQNPVCNHLTFGSVIMTLSNPPTFQVAPGRPDVSGYVRYSFVARRGLARCN